MSTFLLFSPLFQDDRIFYLVESQRPVGEGGTDHLAMLTRAGLWSGPPWPWINGKIILFWQGVQIILVCRKQWVARNVDREKISNFKLEKPAPTCSNLFERVPTIFKNPFGLHFRRRFDGRRSDPNFRLAPLQWTVGHFHFLGAMRSRQKLKTNYHTQ